MRALRQPIELDYRDQFGFFDDFFVYTDAAVWTKTLNGAGTSVSTTSGLGGVVTLTTGATLNNEAAITRTNQNWLFGDDTPLIMETQLSWTESSTNKVGFFAGFSSLASGFAAGSGMLQNSAAGLLASFTGCGIYKIAGTAQWGVITSVGAVQTLTLTDTSKIPGNAGVRNVLRIEVYPVTSTQIDVIFLLNGQQFRDTSARGLPIRHQMISFTGAAAMGPTVEMQAGAASSEVLSIDYIGAWQKRVKNPIIP